MKLTHTTTFLYFLALQSLSDCLNPICKINQYYQILFLQASPWETTSSHISGFALALLVIISVLQLLLTKGMFNCCSDIN